MNEVIVWDEDSECFIEDFAMEEYMPLNDIFKSNGYQFFNYIGKTDINDKKIYADCSIVEFTVADYKTKDIGYFTYDSDYTSYLVKNSRGVVLKYSKKFIRNLKIIGTLQEDKHLLGEIDERD